MVAKTVDIKDAQSQFSELVSLALEGNEVIITQNSKPVARLVPLSAASQPRVAGLNRDQIAASEDFDEPLADEFWTGSR